MDFQTFKRRLETEKILKILYRIDYYIFVSVSFTFSLNFTIILIFRSTKPILKA